MMVADVRLAWERSVSSDVTGRKIVVVTRRGEDVETKTAELTPEISSYEIVVKAVSSVSFNTVVKDSEGHDTPSETYNFSVGDLIAPLPDTNLSHEVLGVREVPDV